MYERALPLYALVRYEYSVEKTGHKVQQGNVKFSLKFIKLKGTVVELLLLFRHFFAYQIFHYRKFKSP